MQTRLISEKPPIRLQTAHVHNRPIRLAYIVNRAIDQPLLHQVLNYNTSLWGGKYNLFVPSDGTEIRQDWWNILIRYDPDEILYVGDIEEALTRNIFDAIQPFEHARWSNTIIEHLGKQVGPDLVCQCIIYFNDFMI